MDGDQPKLLNWAEICKTEKPRNSKNNVNPLTIKSEAENLNDDSKVRLAPSEISLPLSEESDSAKPESNPENQESEQSEIADSNDDQGLKQDDKKEFSTSKPKSKPLQQKKDDSEEVDPETLALAKETMAFAKNIVKLSKTQSYPAEEKANKALKMATTNQTKVEENSTKLALVGENSQLLAEHRTDINTLQKDKINTNEKIDKKSDSLKQEFTSKYQSLETKFDNLKSDVSSKCNSAVKNSEKAMDVSDYALFLAKISLGISAALFLIYGLSVLRNRNVFRIEETIEQIMQRIMEGILFFVSLIN